LTIDGTDLFLSYSVHSISVKMKDSAPVLYPNEQVGKKVTEYSEDHTLSLPKELTDFHAWILETQETANYTISTFQAKSLLWLARLAGAKHGNYSLPHCEPGHDD
jgi:hypothetical protein